MANSSRVLSVAIGTALVSLMSGCATSNPSPFHVYGSPLLQAEDNHVYARERGFDPLEAGDWSAASDTAVASRTTPSTTSKSGAQPAPAASQARVGVTKGNEDSGRKKLPSLSMTRPAKKVAKKTAAPAPKKETPKVEASKIGPGADAAEYVWSIYAVNGLELSAAARKDIPALYKSCKKKGKVSHASRPQIGDIVFFHNTADVNADGRNNDWYTYAAVVESVDEPGTVTAIGWDGKEVGRVQVNLEAGDEVALEGKVVNSRLRQDSSDDAPFTQYFAHQLFAGFCSALGNKPDLVVIENWTPGTDVLAQ